MAFLLLYTQWVCLHFFRVLDVRKFCGCVTSRVQLRPPLSRGNTSLGVRSNLRAHWHAWKPQPIYGMFHSRWSASNLGDLTTRHIRGSLMYEERDSGVAELQTYPWKPWTAINLCMKLARFLHSWGTFNNYMVNRATFVQQYSVKCMQILSF